MPRASMLSLLSTLLSLILNSSPTTSHDSFFIPLNKEFLSKLRNESLYNRHSTPNQYDG
ncbi:hypothetical protein WR25_09270, partial [Diploscapter pachys]